MKKLYKVGIYCRLSVDDASNSAKAKSYIPADESASIENQREILSKFVMLNGWTEVKTYADDGYSGGNFQRPGFLEMLEDARKGVINLILVKDLSRLGRDFVEVGRYTDVVFPSLGCRFVSVLDCLDTEGDNTDMLHFRSLMNDYHLKDLSNKIKSVRYAKMKSGQFLSAYAPYGYRKSEDDKHKLVIDEYAAAVVRRAFSMRRDGAAYGKIAAAFNQDGILSPRGYWHSLYGTGECRYSQIWTCTAVKNLLNSEVYLGNLLMNYTGSRSYKDGIRFHCSCNLLNIVSTLYIFKDFVVRQRDLRRKDVRLILHTVLTHIEYVEFFETANSNCLITVQSVVSNFVEHYDFLHYRMKIVIDKNKAVTHHNLICSTLGRKRKWHNIDAEFFCNPVRITSTLFAKSIPICCASSGVMSCSLKLR
jgi:DNA invertase Pin-like site-specific DNA recombinase